MSGWAQNLLTVKMHKIRITSSQTDILLACGTESKVRLENILTTIESKQKLESNQFLISLRDCFKWHWIVDVIQ